MNSVRPSSALKSNARDQLLGHYSVAILAFLAMESIIFFVTLFSTSFSDTTTAFGIIIYLLITLILQLLAGVFTVGETQLYLNIACSKKPEVVNIFTGFIHHPDKSILVQFFLMLIGTLPLLPAGLFAALYYFTENPLLILLTAVFFAAGMICMVVLYLHYSQVFCLMLDFPHYTVAELFAESKKLMMGHCFELFYLKVSFIPLFLAAFMTCGIGLLWVIPYRNATHISFFLDLVKTNVTEPDSGIFINEVC